jgi:hypothetical protein
MDDKAFKKELERLWNGMRRAFADYRLDDVRKYADVPEGMPVPTREQVRQFLDFMPDLGKAKFLKLAREKDRAGYYIQVGTLDAGQAEVAVIRFQESGGAWKVLGAPHSFGSYSAPAAGEDEAMKWVESEPSLRLFPPD